MLILGITAVASETDAADVEIKENDLKWTFNDSNNKWAVNINLGKSGLNLNGTYSVDGKAIDKFSPSENPNQKGVYTQYVDGEVDLNTQILIIELEDQDKNTYIFSNKEYAITSNTTNGEIVTTVHKAKMGETVNFSVKSIDGYMLKDGTLSINNGTVLYVTIPGGYSFTMPAKDVVITAVFEKIPTHTITVEPSENGTVTASSVEAAAGATVTLTITPDETYALDELTVTDAQDNKIVVVDGKFVMPASPVKVKATFTDAERFEVTFDEDITVKNAVSGEPYTSPAMIPSGTIVSVMAAEKIGQVATISLVSSVTSTK